MKDTIKKIATINIIALLTCLIAFGLEALINKHIIAFSAFLAVIVIVNAAILVTKFIINPIYEWIEKL
jgi:hypothetical protein